MRMCAAARACVSVPPRAYSVCSKVPRSAMCICLRRIQSGSVSLSSTVLLFFSLLLAT